MKKADLKEFIKQTMLETAPKKDTGAMTPEEEMMFADDEEKEENKEEPLEEVVKKADMIVESWAKKQTMTEEMHGGYLELLEMNPAFEEGVAKVLQAWNDWKSGDMTEPYMVEEAKQDVLAYLSSMMK